MRNSPGVRTAGPRAPADHLRPLTSRGVTVPEQKIPEQKIIAVVRATGGSRDLDLVRTLNPQLQTFRSRLRSHPVPPQ
jgi:hypothetical protein